MIRARQCRRNRLTLRVRITLEIQSRRVCSSARAPGRLPGLLPTLSKHGSGRFVRHPRFRYGAFNTIIRRQGSKKVRSRPGQPNPIAEELRKAFQSRNPETNGLLQSITAFSRSIRGTWMAYRHRHIFCSQHKLASMESTRGWYLGCEAIRKAFR